MVFVRGLYCKESVYPVVGMQAGAGGEAGGEHSVLGRQRRERVYVLDCFPTASIHTHTHPLIDSITTSGLVSILLIQMLSPE
jgi:hypothetical protein